MLLLVDLRPQQVSQLEGRLDVAAGVFRRLVGVDHVHRQLIAAAADQRDDLGHLGCRAG